MKIYIYKKKKWLRLFFAVPENFSLIDSLVNMDSVLDKFLIENFIYCPVLATLFLDLDGFCLRDIFSDPPWVFFYLF